MGGNFLIVLIKNLIENCVPPFPQNSTSRDLSSGINRTSAQKCRYNSVYFSVGKNQNGDEYFSIMVHAYDKNIKICKIMM